MKLLVIFLLVTFVMGKSLEGSQLVPVEASSSCADGAYNSKHKEGYMDALDVETFEHKDKIRKGQLFFKSDCKTVTKSMHVILLIDASGGECFGAFEQAKNYLRQLPDIIPDHAWITVIPWSHTYEVRGFMASDKLGILQYINRMPCGGGNYIDVMEEVMRRFEARKADVKILINAGGGRFPDWTYYCRQMIKQNVNIISVHTGYNDIEKGDPKATNNMKGCVNPDKLDTNYIRITPDDAAMSKEHFQLVMSTQCHPFMINED